MYQAYPYDNLTNSSSVRSGQRSFVHRRSPSSASGSMSNEERQLETYYSPYTRRAGDYSGYFSRQNSIDSTSSDRPMFLDVGSGTKLRSSLKKSNYLAFALRSQNAGGSSSSGPGILTL